MQSMSKWDAVVLYQGKDSATDLMTKEHLLNIRKLEAYVKDSVDWKKLCRVTSSSDLTCSSQALESPLDALPDMGITDLNSATEEVIRLAFSRFFQNKKLFNKYKKLFPKRDTIAIDGQVHYMRSFLNFGAPLKIDNVQYTDATDRWAE